MVEADDERFARDTDQPGDHLLQFPGRDLAGAATAVRIASQSHRADVGRLGAANTGAVTGRLRFCAEASGHLVGFLIFKISVTEYPGQAGSIPVRLRQLDDMRRAVARKVSAHARGSAPSRSTDRFPARRLAPRRAAAPSGPHSGA